MSIENQAHIGPGKVVQCWGSLASSIGKSPVFKQKMWVRVPHKTPNLTGHVIVAILTKPQ